MPPHPETSPPDPQRRLAARIEELFLRHGRTLSDDDTAEAFRITLQVMGDLLEGAHVHGVVGDAAYGELAAMVEGMRAAPSLL